MAAWNRTPSRAALVLAILLVVGPARAVQYEVPILADSVGDLRSLLENGDIDQEEFDRLVELLEQPLDVNTASRDALFDLPGITSPMIERLIAAREAAPLRSMADLRELDLPENVLRQIEPFVTFEAPEPPDVVERKPLSGDVDLRGIDELGDDRSPAFGLRFRGEAAERVGIGLSAVLQERLGRFEYHDERPERGLTYLSAGRERVRPHVPKGYVFMDEGEWAFIAGTYEAGFAERLTFNASTRSRPNGFYEDYQVSESSESARFSAPERLLGVAATMRGLEVGDGHYLDGTVFWSWMPHEVAQHQIPSRLREEQAPGATNPLVCEEGVDPTLCADDDQKVGRLSQKQLRMAFTEMLFGGNLAWSPGPRLKIGATSYYSMVDFPASDDLHFSRSAPYPDRRRFGAYGLHFETNFGRTVTSGEYARTFGGAQAAFLRSTTGFRLFDLEIEGRYYGEDWDNPHSSGRAQPDQLFGKRDRDEAGGSVSLVFYPARWMSARVGADIWHRFNLYAAERPDEDAPADDEEGDPVGESDAGGDRRGVTSYELDGRLDFEVTRWLALAVGLQYTDRDIARGGRDTHYFGSGEVERDSGTFRRSGDGSRLAAYAQAAFDIGERTRLVLFYKSTLTDESVSPNNTYYANDSDADDDPARQLHRWFENHYQHDWYVTGSARTRLLDDRLTLQTRVKYLVEDAAWTFRGQEFVEGWLQARWRFAAGTWLQARYRVRAFTDDRHLAKYRSIRQDEPAPEPEHLIKASVGFRF